MIDPVSWFEAIVLGLVQGLTEFIPVSSTAHVLIVSRLFGWEDPGAAFTAVTQIGTELAVIVYFRNDIARIIATWFRSLRDASLRKELDARMGWYIIIGTIPISILGVAFSSQIETAARNLWLVAAMLMASAVGSAITADLGSRTMREETDAMEVMGVSVIRRLVVPRFAAAIMVSFALTGVVCFVGFFASYMFNVYFQNGAPGSFVATFASFATPDDMLLALLKAVIFGAVVAVVSSQKGLSTKGGPTGVANSVNAAVVEAILLLMIINVAISQLAVILTPRTGL